MLAAYNINNLQAFYRSLKVPSPTPHLNTQ